jgi:hypothetical protein
MIIELGKVSAETKGPPYGPEKESVGQTVRPFLGD